MRKITYCGFSSIKHTNIQYKNKWKIQFFYALTGFKSKEQEPIDLEKIEGINHYLTNGEIDWKNTSKT